MFENIIGQSAALQLALDVREGALAPSMVFIGAQASGKGSAALELARALSCENAGAPWGCTCSACTRHRILNHPDLLALGFRPFSAEIAAAADAFLRHTEQDTAVRLLFIRSIQKLLLRFSPILWEDDPKLSKNIADRIELLGDSLDGLASQVSISEKERDKLCASIVDNARKLEMEGMGEYIPVAQIRRASHWSHLSPQGERKLLLIERADRMQESAQNAMLKLLEEPPQGVVIVLTLPYGDALPATILSRLRPYRFQSRSKEAEAEVIRRVFRQEAPLPRFATGSLIREYLDSFLPISQESIRPFAAYFAASLVHQSTLLIRKRSSRDVPMPLAALSAYLAPLSESAGLGRPATDIASSIASIQKASAFSVPGSFRIFLAALLDIYSESLRQGSYIDPRFTELWRTLVGYAANASGVYNLNIPSVLEKFAADFKQETLLMWSV